MFICYMYVFLLPLCKVEISRVSCTQSDHVELAPSHHVQFLCRKVGLYPYSKPSQWHSLYIIVLCGQFQNVFFLFDTRVGNKKNAPPRLADVLTNKTEQKADDNSNKEDQEDDDGDDDDEDDSVPSDDSDNDYIVIVINYGFQ